MKKTVSALAGAFLLAASIAASPASAQHAGGGGGGGGFHGGGGFGGGFHGGGGGFHGGYGGGYRGGGYHGGGFHDGGYRHGGYYRGGYYYGGYPHFLGGFGLGYALGASFYDPWFYDYPLYYGYYGDYGVTEPLVDDDDDYADGPAAPGASSPAAQPRAQANQPAACGSWVWDASQSKYNWVGC